MAAAVEERPRLEDAVELVTTAPEAPGTITRNTSVVVGELFRGANQSVLVAGYAVRQGQKVFQELAARMNQRPTLKVRLFLDIQRKIGDTTAPDQLVRGFFHRFRTTQWPSQTPLPEIYYDERSVRSGDHQATALHAKCVVVDDHDVFISSANFTESAQQRNIELGVLFHSSVIAERITRFFESLLTAGYLQRAGLSGNLGPAMI